MAPNGKALVLGGGGVTGIAWEIGLLHGLQQRGIDLTNADLFVGTSAGSVVAALLTGGVSLEKLYAEHVTAPVTAADRTDAIVDRITPAVVARFVMASAWPGGRRAGRAWLGRAALRAHTVPEQQRREVIARGVPVREWPTQRLLVTAVDAETGDAVAFDRQSGVPLIDAIAASCAVPVVWPPISINGRRYVDGGVRSMANADLAAGYGRVVVLAPLGAALRPSERPTRQVAALGSHVCTTVVLPDAAARAAIGRNVLDYARRIPAARAGRLQADIVAEQVSRVWG